MLATPSTDSWLPRLVAALVVLVTCLIVSTDARAYQEPPWATGQSKGEDLGIFLLTFSPGDDIPSWFGHTALLVRDDHFGVERVYNYGMFSFGPDMLPKFLMGRLEFWVGQASYPRTVRIYTSLNRDVRSQELNLPPEKREEMAKFLAWNVEPENRDYLYDHYFDNCATRIRDAIDNAVDGQFKKGTSGPARFSLREHTRRHTQRNAYIDVILTFWMNSDIDQPIKVWDEMFLPGELERNLRAGTWVNAAGETVPLVKKEEVIFASKDRAPVPDAPSMFWPWAILFGAFVGGVGFALARWWARDLSARRPRVLLGLWHVVIGMVFGIPGLVLVLYHLTDHKITYYNMNFFVANPLTFLALPLGFAIGWGSWRAVRLMRISWLILSGMSVVGLVLMPFVAQDTHIAVSMLLPLNFGMALGFWRIDPNELRPRVS